MKPQIATSNQSEKRGGKVKLPTAFTERGLYMLATILNRTIAKISRLTAAVIEAIEMHLNNIPINSCAAKDVSI